jgi:hypothetical protein
MGCGRSLTRVPPRHDRDLGRSAFVAGVARLAGAGRFSMFSARHRRIAAPRRNRSSCVRLSPWSSFGLPHPHKRHMSTSVVMQNSSPVLITMTDGAKRAEYNRGRSINLVAS